MFELILNTAKLVTSDEARKSATALVEFIRKSPEWEQDICTLEAKIPKEYEEQSLLLSDLTASKLINLNYTSNAINAFISIYSELTRNGFEHGCHKEKDSIKVIIAITKTYVSISVINPKWRKFDIQNALKAHAGFYKSDLITERGRGLILCNELADSLKPILKQTGIKAVVYKDRVDIGLLFFPNLIVMNILNGENNPSLVLKLSTLIEKHPEESIILHFNRDTETGVRRTDVSGLVLKTNKENLVDKQRIYDPAKEIHTHEKSDDDDIFDKQKIYDPVSEIRTREKSNDTIRVVILFTNTNHGNFYIPEEMIAHTWEDALAKLGKSDLLPIIQKPRKTEISKTQNADDIFDEFRNR